MNKKIIQSSGKALEVALRNLNRIHADIQFADRKAGLLLLPSSGLLALLWRHLASSSTPTAPLVLSCIAGFSLIVTVGLAFMVILPRGRWHNRTRSRGVVDSARISIYPTASFEEYRKDLESRTEEDIIRELQELTFDYSHIHRQKYQYVEFTVWATILSTALSLSALLWLRSLP